jgi:hypothetical protein
MAFTVMRILWLNIELAFNCQPVSLTFSGFRRARKPQLEADMLPPTINGMTLHQEAKTNHRNCLRQLTNQRNWKKR